MRDNAGSTAIATLQKAEPTRFHAAEVGCHSVVDAPEGDPGSWSSPRWWIAKLS